MLEHVGHEPDLLQRHQTEQHGICGETTSNMWQRTEEDSRFRSIDREGFANFARRFKQVEIYCRHADAAQPILHRIESGLHVLALISHSHQGDPLRIRPVLRFKNLLLSLSMPAQLHEDVKTLTLIFYRLITIDLHEGSPLLDLRRVVVDESFLDAPPVVPGEIDLLVSDRGELSKELHLAPHLLFLNRREPDVA